MAADTSAVRLAALPDSPAKGSPTDPVAALRERPGAGRPASLAAALHEPASPTPPTVEALLLDAEQTAALLGISSASVYRMRSAGKLPLPVRLGGSVRWSRETLVEWVRMNCPPLKEFEARRAAGNGRGRL